MYSSSPHQRTPTGALPLSPLCLKLEGAPKPGRHANARCPHHPFPAMPPRQKRRKVKQSIQLKTSLPDFFFFPPVFRAALSLLLERIPLWELTAPVCCWFVLYRGETTTHYVVLQVELEMSLVWLSFVLLVFCSFIFFSPRWPVI